MLDPSLEVWKVLCYEVYSPRPLSFINWALNLGNQEVEDSDKKHAAFTLQMSDDYTEEIKYELESKCTLFEGKIISSCPTRASSVRSCGALSSAERKTPKKYM